MVFYKPLAFNLKVSHLKVHGARFTANKLLQKVSHLTFINDCVSGRCQDAIKDGIRCDHRVSAAGSGVPEHCLTLTSITGSDLQGVHDFSKGRLSLWSRLIMKKLSVARQKTFTTPKRATRPKSRSTFDPDFLHAVSLLVPIHSGHQIDGKHSLTDKQQANWNVPHGCGNHCVMLVA